MLLDQLANVRASVTNNGLVLQIISGLNEGYDNVASCIQQSNPFPPFYKALSRLILEETQKNKLAPSVAITRTTHFCP